jgi:hypothetical protein
MMPHIERSTFQWNWHIIQRIETMKFRLGMKTLVNAKNGLTKISEVINI